MTSVMAKGTGGSRAELDEGLLSSGGFSRKRGRHLRGLHLLRDCEATRPYQAERLNSSLRPASST